MAGITWEQIDNIALALFEKYPDVDPLSVRFTDLHMWIVQLEDFEGDPLKSNESKLEAVQMAWYEEWKEDR
jgi:FeS assembly protein IscX